jgi:hypothetical protein
MWVVGCGGRLRGGADGISPSQYGASKAYIIVLILD